LIARALARLHLSHDLNRCRYPAILGASRIAGQEGAMHNSIMPNSTLVGGVVSTAFTEQSGLSAAVSAYLNDGAPTGFEVLRRGAEDAAAYDVFQRWACSDCPDPTALWLCEMMVPAAVLAEWEHEYALSRDDLLERLARILPRAVRQYACSSRLYRGRQPGVPPEGSIVLRHPSRD